MRCPFGSICKSHAGAHLLSLFCFRSCLHPFFFSPTKLSHFTSFTSRARPFGLSVTSFLGRRAPRGIYSIVCDSVINLSNIGTMLVVHLRECTAWKGEIRDTRFSIWMNIQSVRCHYRGYSAKQWLQDPVRY